MYKRQTLWWGTLLYALAIGPLIQAMLPWFQTAPPVPLAGPAGLSLIHI